MPPKEFIEIVPANEDHLPIIQSIAHQTWPLTFGDIISAEQINYMLEWMYSIPSLKAQVAVKGNVFLLAKENEEYLGYASYELNYKNLNKTKLHKIYILPTAQGKGVGQKLIDNVAKIASTASNVSVLLNVNRNNQAVGFYQKNGFEIVSTEDIDIGNGFLMQDFVMEKTLNLNN